MGDTNGPWIIEIRIPERDIGHVLEAQQELRNDLIVAFALESQPSTTFHGRVLKMAAVTAFDEIQGATVLVTADIDRSLLPTLRPGAIARAKILCGQQPLGYVWFHDVWEFLQMALWL